MQSFGRGSLIVVVALVVAVVHAQLVRDPSGRYAKGQVIVGILGQNERPVAGMAQAAGARITRRSLGKDWVLVQLPESWSVERGLTYFNGKTGVRYVEPNYICRASYVPNDFYFPLQWGVKAIEADKAWDVERSNPSTVVAVLDTGIDLTHPEFAGRILAGYNHFHGSSDIRDFYGHGTAVAGIIGARSDNGIGLAGVAPISTINVHKVLGDDGVGTWEAVANGVHGAVNSGVVKVINMSLGGTYFSQALFDACTRAFNSGILIVCGAGNNNSTQEYYPAAFPMCIAVASISQSDRRSDFSNYGGWVDLAAPGEAIISAGLSDTYVYFRGTSAAAPMVSGTAALVWRQQPYATAAHVRAIITGAVDNNDGRYGGSYGRVNPYKALRVHALTWPSKVEQASLGSQGQEANRTCYIQPDAIDRTARYVVFTTASSGLVPNDDNNDYDVFVRDMLTKTTRLISHSFDGSVASGTSGGASISSGGRLVSFESGASNVVQNDLNQKWDCFLYDVSARTVRLVSVGSNGQQGDGDSDSVRVSDDGRYVVFASLATNFDTRDRNGRYDVYWRDLVVGTTIRVTREFLTGEQSNNVSGGCDISADGRFVSFWSDASNLVVADSNNARDIFVWDSQTDTIRRVSVRSNGDQANHYSYNPVISRNGRFVAFDSSASNLVSGDTRGLFDVFVHDFAIGATERVSVTSQGGEPDGDCTNPSISDDGMQVAFTSRAGNLDVRDINPWLDVFVRDRTRNATYLASIAANGGLGDNESIMPAIAGGGSAVAFSSKATNMVPEDLNSVHDIFVRNRGSVSVTPPGVD